MKGHRNNRSGKTGRVSPQGMQLEHHSLSWPNVHSLWRDKADHVWEVVSKRFGFMLIKMDGPDESAEPVKIVDVLGFYQDFFYMGHAKEPKQSEMVVIDGAQE